MNFPKTEQIPNDPDKLPPARRRRAGRLLAPLDADERAAFLDDLGHRTSPSFDFFLFSFAAGIVLSIGLILDSLAISVLGAAIAPLMAPAVGVSIGTVTGSIRFFVRSMIGLLIGSLLVFSTGVLAGYITQNWLTIEVPLAGFNAQLSWTNFLVLALGSIITTAAMLKPQHKPPLASVALAYELYLPLVIAGFGLTGGIPDLFPDGLVVFSVYLAWSALLGALTLAIRGFRPLTIFGYSLGGAVMLVGVILIIGMSGAGAAFGGQIALPTLTPTATLTVTPTLTQTLTPVPPTSTHTPTLTHTPTSTSTKTPTLTPTPMYALVNAAGEKGAVLREEPGGKVLQSYFNGTLMLVLPGIEEVDGGIWVHVLAPDGVEGWMMQQLLATATPAPNW